MGNTHQIGSRPIQALQTIRQTREYFVPDELLAQLLKLAPKQLIVEVRRKIGTTQDGSELGIAGCIVVVVDLT